MADRNDKGQFVKGTPPPSKGRPKGSKNKFTTLKDAFVVAFEDGGKEALGKLRDNDPKAFFGLFRDLFPRQIEQDVKVDQTTTPVDEHPGLREMMEMAERASNTSSTVTMSREGGC
jgi:hypothetical protein